jgi:hypothetical protein
MSQEDFMQSWFHKARSVLLVGLPLALLLTSAALGNQPRLAIGGYDTVAYFTDGKPVPGTAEFQYQWHDTTWQLQARHTETSLPPIRNVTRRNTMVIVRWAYRSRAVIRTRSTQRLGQS